MTTKRFASMYRVSKQAITKIIRKHKSNKSGEIKFRFRGSMYFADRIGNQFLISK
jgi:hypothetical protein